jgi:pSer/pThr/pTyr-binding forkhead associated (FHA) protein
MVLKLIVENDRNELKVYDFSGNYIAAGRAVNNDLVLGERNISRHHFQLEIVDNRIVIEDRDSYNNTFVNDREINDRLEIFVGDVITVGDYNIYLEQDEDSKLKTATIERAEKAVAEEDLILAKSGSLGGKVFSLKGAETVIGSHPSADIYLYSDGIPEVHSKLIFDGNIYLLVKGDYSAEYSLVVNDMEIDSVDMRNGDEFKVDEFLFEFIEKGEEYDPIPYLQIAEEARKERLRKDIKGNKIKSVHDEEDAEVTQVKKLGGFKTIHIVIGAAVLAVIATAVIIFLIVRNSNKDDAGLRKNIKISLESENKDTSTGQESAA